MGRFGHSAFEVRAHRNEDASRESKRHIGEDFWESE
jgi:hypothetical protein